jgi:hypothetical protein
MILAFPLGFNREACAATKATTSTKNRKRTKDEKRKRKEMSEWMKKEMLRETKKREKARKMEILSSHPPGNKSYTTRECRCR